MQRALKVESAERLIATHDWRFTVMEHCKNPWNGECKNNNIEVYIVLRGERLPICRRCWSKLADQNLEW